MSTLRNQFRASVSSLRWQVWWASWGLSYSKHYEDMACGEHCTVYLIVGPFQFCWYQK